MLKRSATDEHVALQAWDAADEYALLHCKQELQLDLSHRILLVNDRFGALACGLHGYSPDSWSDSYVSHLAAQHNLHRNYPGYAPGSVGFIHSTDALQGFYDVVIIKVPKTTALLEHQLYGLRAHLHHNSQVIAAGMIKHLQRSAFRCFEQTIGPLKTSLGWKKSRLIFSFFDPALSVSTSPYPSCYTEDQLGLTMLNHANVFSRERLDLGARFFLAQFSKLPMAKRVIDLACGNGVLGICLQRHQLGAEIEFIDESYMAVDSARQNYAQANFKGAPAPTYSVADGLAEAKNACCDLILCNPPFHQQHSVGVETAQVFFRDAWRCLQLGGELWVVANRHLPYKKILAKQFRSCSVVSVNAKFVVLKAVK